MCSKFHHTCGEFANSWHDICLSGPFKATRNNSEKVVIQEKMTFHLSQPSCKDNIPICDLVPLKTYTCTLITFKKARLLDPNASVKLDMGFW